MATINKSVLTILSISIYLHQHTVIISLKFFKGYVTAATSRDNWGLWDSSPHSFREACPHVLAVKSGLVLPRVQCHSSTIG